MFNEIWEFFFCPMHGVLRPELWPYASLVIGAIVMQWHRLVKFLRTCRKRVEHETH